MNLRNILLAVALVFSGLLSAAQSYENYADSVDFYAGKQEWQKAEEMVRAALKKEPANPNNYILLSNLGTIHRNLGKLKEALADYDAALSITPNAVAILHNRAALYLEMDSISKAYSDYERIMVRDKRDVDSRYYHGMIALEYGNFDIARSDFESMLEIDKNSIDAKRGFAVLAKVQGDYQKAIEYYNEIILKENRASNYISRGECYLELGLLTEADNDIQEAQKLEPSNPDVFVLKARSAELRFRYDDAEMYAKKALELGAEEDLVSKFFTKKDK